MSKTILRWGVIILILLLAIFVGQQVFAYDREFEATWSIVKGEDIAHTTYEIQQCYRGDVGDTWGCNILKGLFKHQPGSQTHIHEWTTDVTAGEEGRYRIRTRWPEWDEDGEAVPGEFQTSDWSNSVNLIMTTEGQRGNKTYASVEHTACTLTAPFATRPDGRGFISSSSSGGQAECPVDVPLPGDYYVWVESFGLDGRTDSFNVEWNDENLSGDARCIFYIPRGTDFAWRRMRCKLMGSETEADRRETWPLNRGANILRFTRREPQASLRRFLVTNSATYDPSKLAVLTNVGPDGVETDQDSIEVTGVVGPDVVKVTVNNTETPILVDNLFAHTEPLATGDNLIEVGAAKINGEGVLGMGNAVNLTVTRTGDTTQPPLKAPGDFRIDPLETITIITGHITMQLVPD